MIIWTLLLDVVRFSINGNSWFLFLTHLFFKFESVFVWFFLSSISLFVSLFLVVVVCTFSSCRITLQLEPSPLLIGDLILSNLATNPRQS